ncbi:putative mitochondrial fission protein ELM1 [Helianthus annuus]|nr:putative mitochondrial fission protein ELM1 [Helianthus annuus]
MKPIRLPEPPSSPPRGVPDIFEGGVYGVVKRVVIIGNDFPASENQSAGLVRAIGLSEKQTLYLMDVCIEEFRLTKNCL